MTLYIIYLRSWEVSLLIQTYVYLACTTPHVELRWKGHAGYSPSLWAWAHHTALDSQDLKWFHWVTMKESAESQFFQRIWSNGYGFVNRYWWLQIFLDLWLHLSCLCFGFKIFLCVQLPSDSLFLLDSLQSWGSSSHLQRSLSNIYNF